MKCPKCQYISFDQGVRCRNCGYEFSLSVDVADLDLPIRTGDEAVGPMADFSLATAEPAPQMNEYEAERPLRGASHGHRVPELPLFRGPADEDAPLVKLPAVPRAPVAVRKSSPRPVQRPAAEEPALDLEPAVASPTRAAARSAPLPVDAESVLQRAETASAGLRLVAATIDLVVLGTIDAAVLYLTLRSCGLTFAEAEQIPRLPFAAFIALLNGGYVAAFTAAGGQSIGKMAAGIKVINMDDSARTNRVPLGQAVVRAAGYLVSALPAGLGFLPGLFGVERRTLHDRLAHTRVVKV